MSSSHASKELDLVTRSIDLTTAIVRGTKLDLVSIVQDASTNIASHVIKWLAREQISEHSFVRTMKLGLDIAQPNETGLEVLLGLEHTSSRLYAFHLILPGSLGRTILYDEQLKWICTTEAVLLKYHSTEYTVDALCRLFIIHNMDEDDARADATESIIRPVLAKTVDSIHLHITNIGLRTDTSFKYLDHLTKHYMDHFNMADMIQELVKVSGYDLLLQMNCYMVEIIDWITTHWSGLLVLCVDNEILFRETLGTSGRTLTAAIYNSCTAQGECAPGTHLQSFDLGKVTGQAGGASEHVFSGGLDVDETAAEFDLDSRHRSSLYDIRNPFKTYHLYLNAKEQRAAERAGQEVVHCILSLPVTSLWVIENNANNPVQFRSSILGLRVDSQSTTKFRWWLKKVPTIVQKNLGSPNPPRKLFSSKHPVEDGTDWGYRRYEYPIAEIAQWYPEISAIMQLAYDRCECGCSEEDFEMLLTSQPEMNPGCLVNLIFVEALLQIVHAMADAAGAEDISNLRGRDSSISLVEGAKLFLGCIAAYGTIFWDSWFRLCSSAVTGLPYDMASTDSIDNRNDGLLFAVAGSMTVAPSWLTLEKEIKLKGSWGIKTLNGSISGLEADIALIEAQSTNRAVKDITPSPISLVSGGQDADEVDLESVIFSNVGKLYRIATIVRTKSALRLISPLGIYKAMIEAARPRCVHGSIEEVTVCPWTLNDLILGWDSHNRPTPGFPHIAMVANSFIKQNIAIGLTGECALQSGSCCFSCLAKKAGMLNIIGICGMSTNKMKYITTI
ncbi:hypothetical protein FQN49_006227 [Arthroderma sp. PD_2]|nr:hypothetical protein FQN49_006227 [Arthroderma sp. PD_2]